MFDLCSPLHTYVQNWKESDIHTVLQCSVNMYVDQRVTRSSVLSAEHDGLPQVQHTLASLRHVS